MQNEYTKPVDYRAELERCAKEIRNAETAIRTGISPDTKAGITGHEAKIWRKDWIEEEKLIRREAQQQGITV